MSVPDPSFMPAQMLNALFWQWANQSYNAAFNYANRNATIPVDMKSMWSALLCAARQAAGLCTRAY